MTEGQGQSKGLVRRKLHRVFFDTEDLDYLFLWALGYTPYGGAAFGEILLAVTRTKESDPVTFGEAWASLGKSLESRASAALGGGHRVSARSQYLRACNYWRMSERLVDPVKEHALLMDRWKSARRCFRTAASLFEPAIEIFDVPFDRGVLTGYFMLASADNNERPTLIVIAGGETTAEELFFLNGQAGIDRGYNVLLIDLPGQGGALRLHGMPAQPDTERPLGAVLDKLVQDPRVDATKVAIQGLSFGGYFVSRAVLHEHRFAAVVLNPPLVDPKALFTAGMPHITEIGDTSLESPDIDPYALASLKRFFYMLGVKNMSAFVERAGAFKHDLPPNAITCPVLCLTAAGEPPESHRQTKEFLSMLPKNTKSRTVFFDESTGATSHCQHDNQTLQNEVLFDWLDDVFAVRS